MNETILYTHIDTPDCSYCNKAKELFEKNNIEFTIQIVGQDLTPRDLYNKIGPYKISGDVAIFPQIIYEGKHLKGGYPDLVSLLGVAEKSKTNLDIEIVYPHQEDGWLDIILSQTVMDRLNQYISVAKVSKVSQKNMLAGQISRSFKLIDEEDWFLKNGLGEVRFGFDFQGARIVLS